MKILGMIAEYNPFHNGHLYHLKQAKALSGAEYCIAVMSGNFVQRGEPACYDKWTRANAAVANGIDLVVELPVDFALASAERFAFGGVYLLDCLGIVTHLAFGAESAQELLCNAAEKLAEENTSFRQALKQHLSEGLSFPAARQKAMGDNPVLSHPNNILGIEYLKALQQLNSKIIPVVIKRHGCGHHDPNPQGEFASGSAIRRLLQSGLDISAYLPRPSYEAIEGKKPVFSFNFDKLLPYAVISQSPESIAEIGQIQEGLENRIYQCAFSASSVAELIEAVKTKRYPYTSVSRMLYQILCRIRKDKLAAHPAYCRVLAFNHKGTELLREIKQKSSLPVITKPADLSLSPQEKTELEMDFFASDLYYLAGGLQKKGRVDYVTSPIYRKE